MERERDAAVRCSAWLGSVGVMTARTLDEQTNKQDDGKIKAGTDGSNPRGQELSIIAKNENGSAEHHHHANNQKSNRVVAISAMKSHHKPKCPRHEGDEKREQKKPESFDDLHVGVTPPNDPSSATRPTSGHDCNRSVMAGFAAAHG